MEKLLVTGGAGYIGSHFIQYLVREKGFVPKDIVVFDNLDQGHAEDLPLGVNLIQGDLKVKKEIFNAFKQHDFKAVVHFAGVLNVAESMKSPSKYFENNVVGGFNLIEAMRGSECRAIVFSSSCTVYGSAKSPVVESITNEPISPYGESKLQFERLLRWYSEVYGFKAVSLRYFNAAGAAYGIGESHSPEIHIIPSVLNAIQNGSEITVYGNDYETPDGTCVRDYLHVLDLADAHIKALEYMQTTNVPFSVFNLGTGKGTSVQQIISKAEKITGESAKVKYAPRRLGDVSEMVANANKAKQELKWKTEYTIDDCIKDAWRASSNRKQ